VKQLMAFSQNGVIDEATYSKMTEGLINLGDLAAPLPPMSKFIDPSFVKEAWE
jgi:hypothetical protein